MNGRGSSGFTLIEVMIVVVIVAILAAIAVPSYDRYVIKSRRAECTTVMLGYANALQRKFTLPPYSYLTDTGTGGPAVVDILGFGSCANGSYTVALDAGATDATTFRIRATPQGVQARGDKLCGALTLTNAGVKGATAPDDLTGEPNSDLGRQCW